MKKRFKKGSAAAKRYMARLRGMKKGSRSKVRSNFKTKARRLKPMARRRRFKKRSSRRSAGYGLLGQAVAAAAYGGLRGYAGNFLAPLTAKLPLGKYADNVVLGTASYFLARWGKLPLLKKLGKAGLIVEAAMFGSDLASGRAGNQGGF